MKTPATQNDPQPLPRREMSVTQIIKAIFGMAGLVTVVALVVILHRNSDEYKEKTRPKSYIPGNEAVEISLFSRGNITYLVFLSKNGSIAVQNYTADSLRMVEYIDYEQSIKDTSFTADLFPIDPPTKISVLPQRIYSIDRLPAK